jgi:hypothetical protein
MIAAFVFGQFVAFYSFIPNIEMKQSKFLKLLLPFVSLKVFFRGEAVQR